MRPSESGLSQEAKKLLIASYQTRRDQGKIFRLEVGGDTLVRAGDNLNERGLMWRLALDELEQKGLVTKRQTDHTILYELTKYGIEQAALLAATETTEKDDKKGESESKP